MAAFLEGVVSITTDFGTEAGLAEFHNADLRALLPAWLQIAPIEHDADGLPEAF